MQTLAGGTRIDAYTRTTDTQHDCKIERVLSTSTCHHHPPARSPTPAYSSPKESGSKRMKTTLATSVLSKCDTLCSQEHSDDTRCTQKQSEAHSTKPYIIIGAMPSPKFNSHLPRGRYSEHSTLVPAFAVMPCKRKADTIKNQMHRSLPIACFACIEASSGASEAQCPDGCR